MLLGCEHCGRVIGLVQEVRIEHCPECGRSMHRVDGAEARELARERRVAEQFRAVSRTRLGQSRRSRHRASGG